MAVGVSLALVCLAILGVMPVLAGLNPAGVDGLTFTIAVTGWQLAAAMPLLLVERVRRKAAPATAPASVPAAPRQGARAMAIALLTGCMFGLSTYMYVVAAQKIGAVNFVVLLQAYPLIALMLEALLMRSRKSAGEWAFTALIVAAIIYLMTQGTFRLSEMSWWSAYALVVPFLWALAHILLRPVLIAAQVSPNTVTVARLVISGAFLLALHAAFGTKGALSALTQWSVLKAAMPLGIAYYLDLLAWFYAVRHIDVSLGSAFTVPAPAITMLITVYFLGGAIEPWQVAAMVVAVIGLYGLLVSARARQARAIR